MNTMLYEPFNNCNVLDEVYQNSIIINDAIKTIDDAVNEATLDMKTNKEIMMKGEK